jgi:hypothetical protein
VPTARAHVADTGTSIAHSPAVIGPTFHRATSGASTNIISSIVASFNPSNIDASSRNPISSPIHTLAQPPRHNPIDAPNHFHYLPRQIEPKSLKTLRLMVEGAAAERLLRL